MSNRVWPQWEDTNYDADANTIPFADALEHSEYADEIDGDITQKEAVGRRTKVWRNIHENMNFRSEINRTRLDDLHKSIAWADVMIRFRYYKAQSAIRRTKKSISRSICPNH